MKQKKYLLVSVDNHSGCPSALFSPIPTIDRVTEFLAEYIATNGIPKRIQTDPGTAFRSEKFKQFCEKYFIEHIICLIRDHRGNGKVERMIRTVNERLRTSKKIVVERERSGLSKILFAQDQKRGRWKISVRETYGQKAKYFEISYDRKVYFRQRPKDRT